MSRRRRTTRTAPGELIAWYDEHRVDEVALYDITVRASISLGALLVERLLAAEGERERAHWIARDRLVRRQRHALNPEDRAELVAQQEAWLHEAEALMPPPRSWRRLLPPWRRG